VFSERVTSKFLLLQTEVKIFHSSEAMPLMETEFAGFEKK